MDTALAGHLTSLLDPDDADRRATSLLQLLASPRRLGQATALALVATRLVSEAEARRICAAFALASAALASPPTGPLDAPERVARAVPELWTSPVEELWLLPVDPGLRLLGRELVARGGPASCAVPPADVLRRVLVAGATGMFLVHNHPSGDPTPSRHDRRFTSEVRRRASELDLQLHDHLVVAGLSWASCVSLSGGSVLDREDLP